PAWVIGQSRLDVGPLEMWWKVRLPIALPWLLCSLLATVALAATEMTVVNLYGYRTVADEFYLFYASEASLARILWTCFLPLVLASFFLMALLVWRRRLPKFATNDAPGLHQDAREVDAPLPRWVKWLAGSVVGLTATLTVAVPIVGLLVKTGHQIVVTGDVRTTSWSPAQCWDALAAAPSTFAAEYSWTIVIAVTTGLAAAVLAWMPAAIGRIHRRWGYCFDAITVVLVLIPGPVVGILVVRFFQLELPGFRQLYQRTLLPTIVALLFRAGPVAYWIWRAGYRGIGEVVFEVARLDASWWRRLWRVDLALLRRTALAALLAAGIVASGDVPAMLLVLSPGVTTVGTRLFQLLHSGARYQEAALALWYVAGVVSIVMIW
ncbi:MAG: amino acid ABC transporter permease, partial [Pirellulales bacterium]|nr:amino acid ABC transporter permease [Pirellulales bacterium]